MSSVMSHPTSRLGRLLSDHQLRLALTEDDYLTEVATAAGTTPAAVRRWMANRPITCPTVLRRVIANLALDRDAVTRCTDPALLLAATWCPDLGHRLARARHDADLDKDQLAALCEVSSATVHRWEKATVAPRPAALQRALGALGLDASDLLPLGHWPPADVPVGDRSVFGTWLLAGRRRLGLSQSALAARLSVSQGCAQAWECGRAFPADATWASLAARFTEAGMPVTAAQMLLMQPMERDAVPSRTPLGVALRDARRARRLHIAAAAALIGTTAESVRAWERGERDPKPAQLGAAVKALGMDVDAATAAVMVTRSPGRRDRGAWVLARAAVLGMRPQDLAVRAGVHRNEVSFWAMGKAPVPDRHLPALARVLKTSQRQLREALAEPDTEHTRRAHALRDARQRAHLSQNQVAAVLGMTQSHWSKFERGLERPSEEVVAAFTALTLAA